MWCDVMWCHVMWCDVMPPPRHPASEDPPHVPAPGQSSATGESLRVAGFKLWWCWVVMDLLAANILPTWWLWIEVEFMSTPASIHVPDTTPGCVKQSSYFVGWTSVGGIWARLGLDKRSVVSLNSKSDFIMYLMYSQYNLMYWLSMYVPKYYYLISVHAHCFRLASDIPSQTSLLTGTAAFETPLHSII